MKKWTLLMLLIELVKVNGKPFDSNPQILPKGQLCVEVKIDNNDNIAVKWNIVPKTQSNFEVNLEALHINGSKQTKKFPAYVDKYTFNDLIAGEIYSIKVCRFYNSHAYLECKEKKITTKPKFPFSFEATGIGEETLFIQWLPPIYLGEFTHYEVTIIPPKRTMILDKIEKKIKIDGLIPGKLYNVSVKTISNGERSDPLSIQLRTSPPRPLNVKLNQSSLTSTSFQLLWDKPNVECEFNEHHIFITDIRGNSFFKHQFTPIVISKDQNSYTFKNLIPGRNYLSSVARISGAIASDPISPFEGAITTKLH